MQWPMGEDEVVAPSEVDGEACGYYLYGITRADGQEGLEVLSQEGIDPTYPVYALSYRDIQALVSQVSLAEFGEGPLKANLNDMEWLKEKVYAHQHVLEKVLARHTLVPMKFCTIYRSEGRVQEMLARHYDDFASLLRRLEGKKEWGVKVYGDGEMLAQRVRETDGKVKELEREMAGKSSGTAYFLRKKVEQSIAEEIERVKGECAQRSHDCLSSQAEESVINPLQGQEMTGRKEEMILNGAYLVAEEKLAHFREEVESLRVEYGGFGLSYELTGPWPPYNFVALTLEESASDA